jgi:hypothetical protein
LENISPVRLAAALWDDCLAGRPLDLERVDALTALALDSDEAVALTASRQLFAQLVEPLADRFEPALCDRYAALFARVLAQALPGLGDLVGCSLLTTGPAEAGLVEATPAEPSSPRLGLAVPGPAEPAAALPELAGSGSAEPAAVGLGPFGFDDAANYVERYRQVRRVRPPEFDPTEVVVLSRVTLGADINVTSVLMDAARRRYPHARLVFAGPRKAWELFAGSTWEFVEIPYGRTALLRDRLAACAPLRELVNRPGVLLLDPDSRLTQLGLLPVCDARAHHLFESRAYGGSSAAALPELARQWCAATLGVNDAEPWFHPARTLPPPGSRVATVSFGIGENPAKRVADPFEESVLRALLDAGYQVLLDTGAPGGEEESRVRAVVDRLGEAGERIALHTGSFANFAAFIAQSRLYVGYDSAGQHAAAAVDVPLVSVFGGYCSERMLARWSPASHGPMRILTTPGRTVEELIALARTAIAELSAE